MTISKQEIIYKVTKTLPQVETRRHRLILYQESTPMEPEAQLEWEQAGLTPVAINLPLSEKLIEIPNKRRSTNVLSIIRQLLNEADQGQPLLIHHVEMIFLPELKISPVSLLEELSRDRTIVVAWPGIVADGKVSYATPDHPEYLEPKTIDAIIIK